MAATAKNARRTASRERRRQQLIDATMKCIARNGMSSTSIGDVAKEAGLSQGIVNLHFDSKDNLLAETLRFLAEEYDREFMRTLEGPPSDAAGKLSRLMEMDLCAPVFQRRKLAVWFAFWAEVQFVPTYRQICAAREEKYERIIRELALEVIEDGGYSNLSAHTVAGTLMSMTDGMWLSMLVNPKKFDRDAALLTLKSYLGAIFPKHFTQAG